MLYKFKSRAAGDVIMTAPVGDAVLRAMGRDPAPTGIFEAGALPRLVEALETAVSSDQMHRQGSEDEVDSSSGGVNERVSLKQRAWPLLEMMKRAAAAGQDIVWGV